MSKSTLDDVREGPPRRGETLRRLGLAMLILVLVLGAAGLLGDQDRTEGATEGDYTLSLEYPQSSRAGLDVPWQLTITSATGFGDEVVVRVSSEYFASFQYHGMSPEPVTQSSDGTYTYWTFAPPPGQQLVIEVNHTVKPSSWLPTDGQVAILIDGRPVAPIDFTTLVFP